MLGGPAQYTPAGGYPRMLAHHLGLNVTVEQRRRFVTLREAPVPRWGWGVAPPYLG